MCPASLLSHTLAAYKYALPPNVHAMFVVAVVAPMFTMLRQTGQWATAPNALLAVVVVVVVVVAASVLPNHTR